MRRLRTLQEGRGRCRGPARSRIVGGWRVRSMRTPRRLPGAGDNNNRGDNRERALRCRRCGGGGANGGGAVAALRSWVSPRRVDGPPGVGGRRSRTQKRPSRGEGRTGNREDRLDQLRMQTRVHAPARLSRRRAATTTTAAGRVAQGKASWFRDVLNRRGPEDPPRYGRVRAASSATGPWGLRTVSPGCPGPGREPPVGILHSCGWAGPRGSCGIPGRAGHPCRRRAEPRHPWTLPGGSDPLETLNLKDYLPRCSCRGTWT